jgi:Zn-dependent M32 family carboxypeptidase
VTSWLGETIHSKGRLLGFDDLVVHATGKKLSPAPLISHLESRYLKENKISATST